MKQPALFGDGELADAPPPIVTSAAAIWNEFAVKNKWRKCNSLDKARRAAIIRAVQDYGGLVGFTNGLTQVERSRFVMGKVPPRPGSGFRQFQASIDWYCQIRTVRQVLEDFYEDDGGQDGVEGASFQQRLKAAAGIDWEARLRRYQGKKSFWHVPTEGNRPEDPGPHKADAALIASWRAKHGIGEVKQRADETREQRLAGMVVSLRNHGFWERANNAEVELAGLEGRAPVLVPAPDVARHGMDRIDGRAFDEVLPMKPPPYRPQPRPSEAEATRAMAAAQDVEYEMVPEDAFGSYEDD